MYKRRYKYVKADESKGHLVSAAKSYKRIIRPIIQNTLITICYTFLTLVESYTSQHKFVIISRDFNAKTSNMPDIVKVDQNIFNSIDINISKC